MATAITGIAPARADELRPSDFADLVRANQAMVYSIAYHFLNNRDRAEELAQDVFLQLHKNLHKLSSPEHAVNWLRKVTCHRCIDAARQLKQRAEIELDQAPEPAVQPAYDDPFLAEKLRKLVASLPEKKRLLVILRYQEEMEFEEIAKVLRTPARTLRTQLCRTLAQLRRKASSMVEGNRS